MSPYKRVLVLANETVAGHELQTLLAGMARAGETEIHVVVPALSSRFRYFMSDVDGPRAHAQERLERSLKIMSQAGIDATGAIGDADPVRAFEDATVVFVPDYVVISTHPPGRSNWLEKDVVERVRKKTDVPVTHVVVDLEAVRQGESSQAA